MAERKSPKRFRPATSPEGRENQLISLAYNLVEKKLRDGTASSQETTHFLKMGSTRGAIEMEKIKNENLLLAAKRDQLASIDEIRKLNEEAIQVMRIYKGEERYQEDYYESG